MEEIYHITQILMKLMISKEIEAVEDYINAMYFYLDEEVFIELIDNANSHIRKHYPGLSEWWHEHLEGVLEEESKQTEDLLVIPEESITINAILDFVHVLLDGSFKEGIDFKVEGGLCLTPKAFNYIKEHGDYIDESYKNLNILAKVPIKKYEHSESDKKNQD